MNLVVRSLALNGWAALPGRLRVALPKSLMITFNIYIYNGLITTNKKSPYEGKLSE